MEQFFGILQRGLGQLDATGEYEEGTLHELKESYDLLEEKQQGDVLRIIEQSLKNLPDTYGSYLYLVDTVGCFKGRKSNSVYRSVDES